MEQVVTLSENAEKQIKTILKEHPDKLLKFGVTGGGCSGFQYSFELVEEDDLYNDDEIVEQNDVKIVVDGMSVLFVMGTEIDYANDLLGSYFKFNNPQQVSSCGCGTSFGV